MLFIEIHEVENNRPGLLNIDQIMSIIPARTKDQCLILCNGSGKWINVSESYEELRKKLDDNGILLIGIGDSEDDFVLKPTVDHIEPAVGDLIYQKIKKALNDDGGNNSL